MPDDYENAINLDQMDDEDVRELVLQRLDEDEDFDVDDVEVRVHDGQVRVEGRVGTEGERQHVEHVLSAFGADRYQNDVVVDEVVRAQRAEAADTAHAEDEDADAPLGEPPRHTTDTADHLRPDTRGDLYGTHDMHRAIEEGQSYVPPDGDVQEGVEGDERH